MSQSKRLLGLFAAVFLATTTGAVAFDVSRQAVEADFPRSTKGAASLLRCMVMPQNREIEICVFQAGEAIAISFLFDSETKALRGTSVFFAEKEKDLGAEMGRAALIYARYAHANTVDFTRLMKSATLGGQEVKLTRAVASARKMPPNLYILAFAPSGD